MITGDGRSRASVSSSASVDLTSSVIVEAAVDAVIQGCAEWMTIRVDQVVEAVVGAMTGRIPDYERSTRDRAGQETLRSNVERVIALFLTVLKERRRLTAAQRARIESVGAMRAADGFSLATIQEGVHIAIDEGRAFLLQALLEAGNHHAALTAAHEIARLVQDFEFDLQRAIEAGYRQVSEERVASEARARDVLVRRLLEGGLDSRQLAQTPLGPLAAATRLDVVVARPVAGESDLELEAIADSVEALLGGVAEGPVLFTAPVLHAAAIVVPSSEPEFKVLEAVGRDCGAEFVVEPARGVDDVARAYALLCDLLHLLSPSNEPSGVSAESLLHLRLLFAAPRQRLVEYVERVLGGVFEGAPDCAEDFLLTLLAYYDSPGAQAKQAAFALGLPLSTVKYRLNRVQQLTKCDKVGDRLRLEAAVRIWRYLCEGASLHGDSWWSNGGR